MYVKFLLFDLIFQAKALAEKNQRDLQNQRDQAERHVNTYILFLKFYLFIYFCPVCCPSLCWGWGNIYWGFYVILKLELGQLLTFCNVCLLFFQLFM